MTKQNQINGLKSASNLMENVFLIGLIAELKNLNEGNGDATEIIEFLEEGELNESQI